MQEFFEIAKTDFMATFEGAWIFPLLLVSAAWILWQEKDWSRKILIGVLPLVFLFLYWCPLTGILIMKVLGENVYWRLLWLVTLAVTIPYAGCLLIGKCHGIWREGVFLVCLAVIGLSGKKVLSAEWFEPSTNAYKVPQYVVEVCDVLPENVHVLASNRLTPYLRLYDTTITLEYARNALIFNTRENVDSPIADLYYEVQKSEIDTRAVGLLAKEEGCTFLIFSSNRTYKGDWADYGYRKYADVGDFTIFVDKDYEEGQDTKKWED